QRVDIFHAALDLAPNGVLLVEEGCVVEADEELAVGAMRIAGPRHRADAADVRLAREFGLEVGQLTPAGAGAGRIAALRHEPRDHAVEQDPVVKAVAGQAGDPLDMPRCKVGTKLDDDVTAGRKGESEGVGVGHYDIPWERKGAPM